MTGRLKLPANPTPIREDNCTARTLDEWQAAFLALYRRSVSQTPLSEMMLQMVVDATRLSEAMRKGRYEEAFSCLPRVFSWLFSISSKTAKLPRYSDLSPDGAPLSQVIWTKYPCLCALCAKDQCVCPTWNTDRLEPDTRRGLEADNAAVLADARDHGHRPERLDDWVGMFDGVYGAVNSARSSEGKVLHFWEEVGELEVELRAADWARQDAGSAKVPDVGGATKWEGELADVFSWLSSIYLHIDGSLHNADRVLRAFRDRADQLHKSPPAPRIPMLPLSEWMWLEYGNTSAGIGLRCRRCGRDVCVCERVRRR